MKNEYDSYIYRASNNTFYHNNFVDNSEQVYLPWYGESSTNFWDDGYLSGRNY